MHVAMITETTHTCANEMMGLGLSEGARSSPNKAKADTAMNAEVAHRMEAATLAQAGYNHGLCKDRPQWSPEAQLATADTTATMPKQIHLAPRWEMLRPHKTLAKRAPRTSPETHTAEGGPNGPPHA